MTDDWLADFPSEEEEVGIAFHAEDVDFPLTDTTSIENWIKRVVAHHDAELGSVQYIFCSDHYLHQVNVEFLDHDTLTDIITFPYAKPPVVAGDIFISTERVADNAQDLATSPNEELRRVLIHGILHLCGYGDKTPTEAQRMRALENEALRMY